MATHWIGCSGWVVTAASCTAANWLQDPILQIMQTAQNHSWFPFIEFCHTRMQRQTRFGVKAPFYDTFSFFLYFFLTLSELEELKPPQLSNFHFPDWQIDSDWNSCEQLVNWSDWDDDEISGPECPKWQWKSNKYRVLKYWEMWKMMLLQRKSFMRK